MGKTVRMHGVFVDDSNQRKPSYAGIGPLDSLGAVIVPPESLGRFSDGMGELREELDIPADVELKASPPRKSWLAKNTERRYSLYGKALELARECGVKTVVVVWDHAGVRAFDPDHDDVVHADHVKRQLLEWLYERISRCLEGLDDASEARGFVIADVPGGDRKDEKAWLSDTLELTEYGTEYVARERIEMPIMTAWSHLVPHLQLADLVTSLTTAAVSGKRHAESYVPQLLSLAHADEDGNISGIGVKLHPRTSLGNLHHHVFGQRVCGNVKLPCRTWWFPTAEELRGKN